MRIALFTDGGAGKLGGSDIYVIRLAEALAASGHQIAVVMLNGGSVDTMIRQRCSGFVDRYYTLPSFSSQTLLSALLRGPLRRLRRSLNSDPEQIDQLRLWLREWLLRRWLQRFRPDVGHIHWAGGIAMGVTAAAALHRSGIPVVETLHAAPQPHGPAHLQRQLNQWRHHHHHLVAVSTATRQALRQRYASGAAPAASVLFCGVDMHQLQRAATEQPLALPATLDLICCGHIKPQKGVHILIEAVAQLAQQGIRPTLQLLGDGYLRWQLEQRIAQLGLQQQITFTGFVANPAPWFRRAAICVQCSILSEGLPLTICEAMAIGHCAVIATDVGGISEAIRDGETGLLVPPADAEALAAALARLLRDESLRRRLAMNGHRFACEHLSFQRSVEGYLQRYQQPYSERQQQLSTTASDVVSAISDTIAQ